jgi:hypothetical protein
VPDVLQAGILVGADDLWCRVRGAVVDDDQLDVSMGLTEAAIERLTQVAGPIVRG